MATGIRVNKISLEVKRTICQPCGVAQEVEEAMAPLRTQEMEEEKSVDKS